MVANRGDRGDEGGHARRAGTDRGATELRERTRLEPGDALFVRVEDTGAVLRLSRAMNPLAFGEEERMVLDDG